MGSLKVARNSLNLIQRTALKVDKREVTQGSLAYNKRNQALDQGRPLLMQQGHVKELAKTGAKLDLSEAHLHNLSGGGTQHLPSLAKESRSCSVQPKRPQESLPVVMLEQKGPVRPNQQLVLRQNAGEYADRRQDALQVALLQSPMRSGAERE